MVQRLFFSSLARVQERHPRLSRRTALVLKWGFGTVGAASMGVGIVASALAIGGLLRSEEAVGYLASKILTHVSLPQQREPPPTSRAPSYSSDDVQVLGGRGEGLSCSIPRPAEWLALPQVLNHSPIGLQMRQACANHDFCYRHGAATYGYTQADCDFLLLNHAFRLCFFIQRQRVNSENKEQRVNSEDICRTRSRVVTLGVRAFGSDSFRPASSEDDRLSEGEDVDGQKSTYFEYDPYPVRSLEYTVYRIASAPSFQLNDPEGPAPSLRRRSLYAFRIRPSGTIITALGWDGGGNPVDLGSISIAGRHEVLTVPPIVARSATGEDWFLWWQRYTMDGTGGRLVAISPSRARPADWRLLESPVGNTAKKDRPAPQDGCVAAGRTAPDAASAIIYIGMPDTCDDPMLSALQAVPGAPSDVEGIFVATLRVHSCRFSPPYLPCFSVGAINPKGSSGYQPLEPQIIRDAFNEPNDQDDQKVDEVVEDHRRSEADRYRNYVGPPFTFAGRQDPELANGPILAWIRRDDEVGKGYKDEAFMRRFRIRRWHDGQRLVERGRSAGSVRLKGFGEEHEPPFVVAHGTETPLLVSLRAEHEESRKYGSAPKRSLLIEGWRLPIEKAQDVRRLRDLDIAEKVSMPCSAPLDSSWLYRAAPVVADGSGGASVALSRFRVPDGVASKAPKPVLDLTSLRIAADGGCFLGPIMTVPIPEMSPAFRSEPTLIADIDEDGKLDLILPRRDQLHRSRVEWAVLLRQEQ